VRRLLYRSRWVACTGRTEMAIRLYDPTFQHLLRQLEAG